MSVFANALKSALLLGIAPSEFWQLSVKEWRALTRAETVFSRADLSVLLENFGEKDE